MNGYSMAHPYSTIDVRSEHDGQVLLVVLNRPEVKNAFNVTMMHELGHLWGDLEALGGVRCVIITGAGTGFCTGADVSMLREGRTEVGATAREELAFLPRHRIDVPVISAVNGVCAGGGLHFVGDADIVIAADQASFIDPHVSVGQVTALEPLMLATRMRFDIVTRMALLGRHERITARQALSYGLVSEVVPLEVLLDRARELASQIASNSPAAVARSRRALVEFERGISGAVMDAGWASIQEHWAHADATEGPAAFLEKREPVWQDLPTT